MQDFFWNAFVVMAVIAVIAGAITIYLATKHPETYRRLKAYDDERKAKNREAMGKAAKFGVETAFRFLKK